MWAAVPLSGRKVDCYINIYLDVEKLEGKPGTATYEGIKKCISIISGSTPLARLPFGLSNQMTAKSLGAIGFLGGPRCCKRGSYLSILSAIDFVKEHFGIEMEKQEIVCEFSSRNNQCLGKNCPFSKANHS